jgi:hypothetical protein
VIPFEESLELVRVSGLSDGALVEGWVRPSAGGPGAAEGAGEGGGGPMKRVVVITGAGISAESGLKTFRGPDGLWRGHRPEEVACPEACWRNPGLVLDFYNERRRAIRGARPNATHPTLVDLERDYGVPTISPIGAPSDARSGRISSVLGSRCPALDEASELVA